MKKLNTRSGLLATTTLCGAVLAIALPAFAPQVALAQATAAPAATQDESTAKKDAAPTEVVVTGSILRRKTVTSDAPLTVMSADDLDKRGITTVQSAIQGLSGNGSGALPNSFSANGAFASGASGASLRGLSTDSTLVLFDGLRAAYYPYADDGVRNFVDLNTIPDAIVDHIEVLQDGASASYGADAIAGVINVITKKQFKGTAITVDGGTSQHGGADSNHASVTWGTGDLGTDGWNFYISGEYQRDDQLMNRDRGYPYNTADLSSSCASSVIDGSKTCRTNAIVNGLQFDDTFLGVSSTSGTVVPIVAPYDPTTKATSGAYQLLNPAAGCGALKSVTLTAAEIAGVVATANKNGTVPNVAPGTTLCQQDLIHDYAIIQPLDKRMSLSAHFTKQWADGTQAWVEGNIYKNEVSYSGAPDYFTRGTAAGNQSPVVQPNPLVLPVYVCPERVNCTTAADRKLNPNNPFASLGEQASILGRFSDIPYTTDDQEESLRLAFGLKGTVFSNWHYNVTGDLMQNELTQTVNGVQNVQHLLDVIADGTYNFVDPSQNSAAVRSYIAPTSILKAKSQLAAIQGDVSHDLWELPGGTTQLGLGASARYESVNDPSANPDAVNPADRYASLINAFGTKGQRTVLSAYYELDLPVLEQLDINTSGREDSYSSGQSAFSPKIGFKYKPFKMLTFRGTASKGFRIPSFGEANSLPTTGYLPNSKAPADFLLLHNNDGYGSPYTLGETTVGTKGLKPEKSTNLTAGVVFEPNRTFNFTLDYYFIKKTGVIAPLDPTAAVAAYFAGAPIPAGFTVIPGVPDPNLPNAKPVPLLVISGYANQNKQETSGFDFGASGRFALPHNIRYTSSFNMTYVEKFNLYLLDGTVDKFAGTIGPQGPTSGSGTPRYRANWQNTFDFSGRATLTATAYYTSGYAVEAEDNGDVNGDCLDSGTVAFYRDQSTPVQCRVKAFIDVDLHGDYKVNARYTVFADIQNAFDAKAPLDAATYGGNNYNPVWANAGIIGRFFKVGVKANF